jgi:hypothetical protein
MKKLNSFDEWKGTHCVFTEDDIYDIEEDEYYRDALGWQEHAHRIDGPAIITPSSQWWINKGRVHRLDGPALVTYCRYHHYYVDDVEYSSIHFLLLLEEVKKLPLELRLTDPRWWVREMK